QEQFENFQTRGYSLYAAIENNPKPIIAAINGYAFGGGLEIALACDMIVAVEGAKMGLPEIALTLIPGGGGTMRLSRKIGYPHAIEMVMTGQTVSAEEMLSLGLINHLYAKDSFMESVTGFAALFANKPADRLQAIKEIARLSVNTDEQAASKKAQDAESAALNKFYQSREGKEKIEAFYRKSLDKKK
ncbi:MAG TPA: enoyl-CoA hydratase/isomerase family protein, partial [Puia sp.]|nr:enoyl-CoA hydratase/isomerase family protein [Puia sp.]